jgi:hypothetical protein
VYTQAQLRDRLLALGIKRDLRTLTDWRQKGLLPPLQHVSAGRGRGVKRYWGEEVLEHAIATHLLLAHHDRAENTRLALWLSGYPVEAAAAQQAWAEHVKRVHQRRQQSAERRSGGYAGIGQISAQGLLKKALAIPWWRERPESDLELLREFIGHTEEWLHNDEERDEAAYRNLISDMIVQFTKGDRKYVYARVKKAWRLVKPASAFATTPYVDLVESLSVDEMRRAHDSLALVADAIRHWAELIAPVDQITRVMLPVWLMHKGVGTLIARLVIVTGRNVPKLPIEKTILSLHDFVMRVQSADITKKNDYIVEFSDRVRSEWQATKEQLSQLWIAAQDESANQPGTLTGPPDPASG